MKARLTAEPILSSVLVWGFGIQGGGSLSSVETSLPAPHIPAFFYISNRTLSLGEWRLLASPGSRTVTPSENGCKLGPLPCLPLYQPGHWFCFLSHRSSPANQHPPVPPKLPAWAGHHTAPSLSGRADLACAGRCS